MRREVRADGTEPETWRKPRVEMSFGRYFFTRLRQGLSHPGEPVQAILNIARFLGREGLRRAAMNFFEFATEMRFGGEFQLRSRGFA
jgi:hypothetical protein